jgi:hypothetical protein
MRQRPLLGSDPHNNESIVGSGVFYAVRSEAVSHEGPSSAGSNTSTVALRVVGSDEKGSLESETVKYGRESHGTRTRE